MKQILVLIALMAFVTGGCAAYKQAESAEYAASEQQPPQAP
jgi:PBP1b-binding outer membrane lipoprotein LpoB